MTGLGEHEASIAAIKRLSVPAFILIFARAHLVNKPVQNDRAPAIVTKLLQLLSVHRGYAFRPIFWTRGVEQIISP